MQIHCKNHDWRIVISILVEIGSTRDRVKTLCSATAQFLVFPISSIVDNLYNCIWGI